MQWEVLDVKKTLPVVTIFNVHVIPYHQKVLYVILNDHELQEQKHVLNSMKFEALGSRDPTIS